MSERHRVVIVGGGFAGLGTAQALRKDDVQVALIDRRNFHLFQPLLYQVATGALSPANIAAPLRAVLKKHSNCLVLLADVTGFDVAGKCVLLGDERVAYDTLVVAAGAGNNYFGKPEWERHAPGLKSIEEATEIRRRILSAFEAAERLGDKSPRDAYLNQIARDCRGTLSILSFKQKDTQEQGTALFATFRIDEARPQNDKAEVPAVGAKASEGFFINGKTKWGPKYARAGAKAFILATMGVAEEDVSAEDFADSTASALSSEQPLRGWKVGFETYTKTDNPNRYVRFYHVKGNDETAVAANRAALDKEYPEVK